MLEQEWTDLAHNVGKDAGWGCWVTPHRAQNSDQSAASTNTINGCPRPIQMQFHPPQPCTLLINGNFWASEELNWSKNGHNGQSASAGAHAGAVPAHQSELQTALDLRPP